MCVTGGAGFIGGHLVDALLSLGATISVIDDLSNSALDHITELVELDPQRVRFVHGSILDERSLADAARGCATVFHLAAIGSVPRSIAEPKRAFSVNASGAVAVLEAARAAGARRFVFASSSSVYGGGEMADGGHGLNGAGLLSTGDHRPIQPRVETMPCSPLSPYAASKLAGEAAVRAWASSYGLKAVSLRFFNVFGPRQSPDSAYAAAIPAFAKRLLAGQAPLIHGDGLQSRDFTYVANVVAALLLGASSDVPLAGQAINIGAGRATNLLELASLLGARCGVPHLAPDFAPARPGEVRHSLADIGLARRTLGYQPFATLEAGLDETIAWFRRAYTPA